MKTNNEYLFMEDIYQHLGNGVNHKKIAVYPQWVQHESFGGISMNLIQDVLAAAAAGTQQPTQDHFCRIPLSDIEPDGGNFYNVGEIEELAATIDAFGLDQPLVVRPNAENPGKYILTGGHRRRRAILLLAKKDPARWAEVDVKMTTSLGGLADRARLILMNKTSRKETEYEQMCEVVELSEIARKWKAEGGTVGGKLREAVASAMGISSAQAGKYQAIHNNLIPALLERYKAGQIGTPVAYELSGLPKRQQEEIATTSPVLSLEDVRTAKAANKAEKKNRQPQNPTFSGAATVAESQIAENTEQSVAGNTMAGPVVRETENLEDAPGGTHAFPHGLEQQAPMAETDVASKNGHTAPAPCRPCQPTQPECDVCEFAKNPAAEQPARFCDNSECRQNTGSPCAEYEKCPEFVRADFTIVHPEERENAETKNNALRLAAALYRNSDETSIQQFARILHYIPSQLREDIAALWETMKERKQHETRY